MGRYVVLQHPSREGFRPLVDVEFGRKYAYLTIDLWRTPFELSPKGLKKVAGFISSYMFARKIYGKTFSFNQDIISFYILKDDLNDVLRKVLKMVKRYSQPIKQFGGVGGSGGR
jgi:hypothetical protein